MAATEMILLLNVAYLILRCPIEVMTSPPLPAGRLPEHGAAAVAGAGEVLGRGAEGDLLSPGRHEQARPGPARQGSLPLQGWNRA